MRRIEFRCALLFLLAVVSHGAVYGEEVTPEPQVERTPASPDGRDAAEITRLLAEARAAAGPNNSDEALRNLDAVLARDPENQEARQLRGDLYFKRGDLDTAMADFAHLRTEKAAAMGARSAQPAVPPNLIQVLAELFRVAAEDANKGNLDSAMSGYNAILSMDIPYESASIAAQNRGNVYRLKRDDERASRDFEQAIRLNPRNAGAYVNRGRMLSERGDDEAAMQDYNEALRFDPKLHEALFNRAISLERLGDRAAALRDLNEVLRLRPEFAETHVAIGELLTASSDWKAARAEFEKALRLDQTMAAAVIGLARVDERRGDDVAATAKLAKAIALKGNIPSAFNLAAWLHATSPVAAARNGKKAVAEALRACELTGWENFGYVDTLAAAYAEQGEFRKAQDFQWFAVSLMSEDEENRAEIEGRVQLYQQHRKYRETRKQREESAKPRKPAPTEEAPTPLAPQPNGPVGSASPQLPPSGDRHDSPPALRRFCA